MFTNLGSEIGKFGAYLGQTARLMVGLPDLYNQLDQHTVFINDATQSTALLNDLAEMCKSHAKTYPCSEAMCKLVHNILILRLSDTTDPMDQD